ncbi:serine hydrolase [Bradyrhizobium prioriisuperbiae]|uniref:serine hydrolase domain-containing protein n=1 Tax=Bradyrhizobium prioriisuperbiae TaxID=2854389 RepID=UPI0028EC3E02|nr:serine hydrolase [Bradyrhizobium prioritasuperba]
MKKANMLILATVSATALGVATLTAAWPSGPARIATGFIAHVLCSEAFVAGRDPGQVLSETIDVMPGVGLISWGIRVEIDRSRRQVTTTLFGNAPGRAAYRDGLGCIMVHDAQPVDAARPPAEAATPPLLPEIAGPVEVDTTDSRLKLALEHAFTEPGTPQFQHTKAVVVVQNGKLIAERYASGYGVDTPIHGWSATKSVINALIGILVRRGKLAVDQPAPVALWQNPGDPRHAITIDHLLRHTSGLAMGSSLKASLRSVFAPVNRMKFIIRDMAEFAEAAPLETTPGEAWNYHDGNTVILSRIIRDAVGGHAADVVRFARQELFDPLGMRNVTLEFDATGTPEGSSQMFATARDWARFGMLYLDDGVIGDRRVLPQGWTRYSAAPTPDAWVGYGAGFWTNLGDSYGAGVRTGLGMPRDAFIAKGSFGKWVIIIPSERMVIVRLAVARDKDDVEGVSRLVRDVIAATRNSGS